MFTKNVNISQEEFWENKAAVPERAKKKMQEIVPPEKSIMSISSTKCAGKKENGASSIVFKSRN